MSDKEMHELTRRECFDLLGQHRMGRLAFVAKVGVMPLIIPVNYLFDVDTVVFRSDPGSMLTAAILGVPVAFEVDGVDEATKGQTGWSVVVHGHAEEVTDTSDLDRLRQVPLVPWAPGAKTHYLRVRPGRVSGQRITLTELPSHWVGSSDVVERDGE